MKTTNNDKLSKEISVEFKVIIFGWLLAVAILVTILCLAALGSTSNQASSFFATIVTLVAIEGAILLGVFIATIRVIVRRKKYKK